MGRQGIVEYMGAGFITGGLFRSNLGLKGFVAGSVIGTACGAVAGVATLSILKLSGVTMKDIYENQFTLRKMRQEYVYIFYNSP